MLTFLNSKSLWIGTDLKRFNQILVHKNDFEQAEYISQS